MVSAINLLSGCVALEMGLGAEAGISAAELSTAELIAGADEAAFFERAIKVGEGGALIIANTEAVNSILERVTVRETYGGSPRLYAEGKTSPFAEVYTKTGRIRLLEGSGRFITINEDIFSVQDGTIKVMSEPKTFSSEVAASNTGN